MSNARSPRAVCSTTIGTNAMCGLLLRLMSVTLLLYVAQAIVGSFFFAVPGEFAEVYDSTSSGKLFGTRFPDTTTLLVRRSASALVFIRAWTFDIFSSNFGGIYYKIKVFAVFYLLPDTIQRVFLCQACPYRLFCLPDSLSIFLKLH